MKRLLLGALVDSPLGRGGVERPGACKQPEASTTASTSGIGRGIGGDTSTKNARSVVGLSGLPRRENDVVLL